MTSNNLQTYLENERKRYRFEVMVAHLKSWGFGYPEAPLAPQ